MVSFIKIPANIISEIRIKVSKIKDFRPNQQTLHRVKFEFPNDIYSQIGLHPLPP